MSKILLSQTKSRRLISCQAPTLSVEGRPALLAGGGWRDIANQSSTARLTHHSARRYSTGHYGQGITAQGSPALSRGRGTICLSSRFPHARRAPRIEEEQTSLLHPMRTVHAMSGLKSLQSPSIRKKYRIQIDGGIDEKWSGGLSSAEDRAGDLADLNSYGVGAPDKLLHNSVAYINCYQ